MGCAQSKTDDSTTTTTEPEVETVAAVAETESVPVEQPPVEQEAVTDTSVEPEAEAAVSPEEPTEELYKIRGHEIDETGVVFYIVQAVEGDISFIKRFSEFKALVAELGNPKRLPALPRSGLGAKLRSKHNVTMIQEREAQLSIVLNAIARDAELAEKEAFKNFVH